MVLQATPLREWLVRLNTGVVKLVKMERACQEEQNGLNFSFIAPSSEEYKNL